MASYFIVNIGNVIHLLENIIYGYQTKQGEELPTCESGKIIHHDAISLRLVMQFLHDIGSKKEKSRNRTTLLNLNLVVWCGDKAVDGRPKPIYTPKNVALLMFNHCPEFYFPCAIIEVTHFTRDNIVVFESENKFTGPLQHQISNCMEYVYSTTNRKKSVSLVTYPHQALREAIVNAVYHRGYDSENSSPTKVYIRPHCLEIISYPGPHPSLKQEAFTRGSDIPPVQARNRRIGEFLKDLRLAEARGTGVETIFRTMERNNNPTPIFDFDTTYFRVNLPAHPKFQTAMLMKEIEELEASGNLSKARKVLQKALDKDQTIISQHLIQKLISLFDNNCDHPNVKKYEAYIEPSTKNRCILLEKLEKWLADKQQARNNITSGVLLVEELVKVHADADDLSSVTDFVCQLYTEKTVETRKLILKSNQAAHQLLEAYGQSLLSEHGNLAYHFACIKYHIYKINTDQKHKSLILQKNAAFLTYLTDARDLLEDAVRMTSENEDRNLFIKQQVQLGYVFRQLSRFNMARNLACEECFEKARGKNASIKINPYF